MCECSFICTRGRHMHLPFTQMELHALTCPLCMQVELHVYAHLPFPWLGSEWLMAQQLATAWGLGTPELDYTSHKSWFANPSSQVCIPLKAQLNKPCYGLVCSVIQSLRLSSKGHWTFLRIQSQVSVRKSMSEIEWKIIVLSLKKKIYILLCILFHVQAQDVRDCLTLITDLFFFS